MRIQTILRTSTLVSLLGWTAVSLGFSSLVPMEASGQTAAPARPAGPAKNRYLGAHPLAGKPPVTGYCYIDVPHVHDFVPDKPAVFQQVGGEYVFTGDPVPYGYDGEKTVFYGHHPIPLPVEVVPAAGTAPPPKFCFLKGPHYHDYPAPQTPGFKQKDNAVFYVGPIPPEVARERPQMERALEVEYQPYVAMRPNVVVTPPPEWQGVVWAPPAPVVVAPSAPNVVVAPSAPAVVVAPAHPSVVVVPPHPPAVIVAPMPGVIFMGHGKGKGWGHGHGWKGGHGWGRGGRRW